MSILDTFFVLFKTDAEEAEKDMASAQAQAESLGDALAKVGDGAEDAAKSAAKVADALDKASAPDTSGVQKLDGALRDAAATAKTVDDALASVGAPDTSGVKKLDGALRDAADAAGEIDDALAPITDEMLKTLPVQERILAGALDQVEAQRNLTQYLAGNEELHERTLHLLGGQAGAEKAIATETTRVARELARAAGQADKLGDEIKEADHAAKGAGRSISGMVKGLVSGLAAVASVGAVIGAVRGHIEEVSQLIERASRARIDVSNYDAWRRAIRAAGGDAERAEGQFEAFADKVTEAFGDAESEAAKALSAMGVSSKDAAGNIKTTDAALLDLADAMSKVSRQTAVDSLRRLGIVDPTMVDMILQGREGLEKLLETQRKSGAITVQQANTYKAFRTAVNGLKDAFRSQVDALLGSVLPAFTRVMDAIKRGLDWMSKNRKVVEGFGIALAAALTVAAVVAAGVYGPAMWSAAAATLAATWPIIAIIAAVLALGAAFALAYEDVSNFLSGQPSLLGDLAAKYGWVRDAIDAVGKSLSWLKQNGAVAWDAIKRGLDIVLPLLKRLADVLLADAAKSFRILASVIRAVWSVAGPILGLIGEALYTVGVIGARVAAAVGRVMLALFTAILNHARPTLELVGGAVRALGGVFGGVASAVQAVWGTFFGWFAEKLGWAIAAARGVLAFARSASEAVNGVAAAPGGPRPPGTPPPAAQMQRAQTGVRQADRAPTNATTATAVAARRPANRTTTVQVDKVEVHTQATDAPGMARGAATALQSQLRRATQDNDDGVDR